MGTHKPNDAKSYYNRGKLYVEYGAYGKVIEDFSMALELYPRYEAAYIKRGFAYFRVSKFESTIQDYNKVLEMQPNLTKMYAARGVMWIHIKEWDYAKSNLTFARNLGVDIIDTFHKFYENVVDFEQKNNIQLPKDIAAMLQR